LNRIGFFLLTVPSLLFVPPQLQLIFFSHYKSPLNLLTFVSHFNEVQRPKTESDISAELDLPFKYLFSNVQLELLLLISIFNSINEPVAIGLDNGEDFAFECGHGVEGVQFIKRLFGKGVDRLKFIEMLLGLDTVVNV